MLDCLRTKCCTDVEVWVIHSFVLTASEKLWRLCKSGLFDFYFCMKVLFVQTRSCQAPTIKILKLLMFIYQSCVTNFERFLQKRPHRTKENNPLIPSLFFLFSRQEASLASLHVFWFSSILTFTGLHLSLMKHRNCLLHALIYLNGYIHEWLQIIQIIFMPTRPIGDKDYSWQRSISNVLMFVNHFMLIWSEMHGSHIFAVIVVV